MSFKFWTVILVMVSLVPATILYCITFAAHVCWIGLRDGWQNAGDFK